MRIMRRRRGTFYTFCRSRRDKDRCGRPWLQRGRAWALLPAPGQSDTANLFADAPDVARFGARLPGAAGARWRARRRWQRRHERPRDESDAEAPAEAEALAAARSVESECGTDSESFRCRCAPSCLQTKRMLPS